MINTDCPCLCPDKLPSQTFVYLGILTAAALFTSGCRPDWGIPRNHYTSSRIDNWLRWIIQNVHIHLSRIQHWHYRLCIMYISIVVNSMTRLIHDWDLMHQREMHCQCKLIFLLSTGVALEECKILAEKLFFEFRRGNWLNTSTDSFTACHYYVLQLEECYYIIVTLVNNYPCFLFFLFENFNLCLYFP